MEEDLKKSHRKVEGETFNNEVNPPSLEEVENTGQKIPDSLEPKFRHKVIVQYRKIKQIILHKVIGMFTDKTEDMIRKRVTDSTWYGKILFAILDVIPLPNFHEVWKAVQKEIPDGTFKEKVKLFWEKLDGTRTLIAIIIALLGYYQVV